MKVSKYILFFIVVCGFVAAKPANHKSDKPILASPLYSYDIAVVKRHMRSHSKKKQLMMVTAVNELGFSPLHFSVASGFTQVFSHYLSLLPKAYHQKVTTKGKYLVHDKDSGRSYSILEGMSLVDLAAKRGDFALVKKLVEMGGKLSIKKGDRYSTLMYAVESLNDHLELVKWLVSKGQKLEIAWQGQPHALLYLSAQANNTEVSKWLFNRLSQNKKYQLDNGLTPLYYALGHKNKALSSYLIDHLKTPHATLKPLGLSLLHKGVAWGDIAIIDALVDKGVPVEKRDRTGKNAFQYAIVYGHGQLVKHFISRYKVNINDKKNRESALLLSLMHGRPQIALTLLKKGAHPRGFHQNGDPLLKLAVEKRYFEVTKEMLKRGADRHAKDKKGLAAREYGKKSPDPYIRSLF